MPPPPGARRHQPPSDHGGVPRLIVQLSREWRAALDRQLAPFALTSQQAILLRLALHETSPHRLAAILGTDTAGMTRLLDRLEQKGYLERNPHPHDRRAIVIELTTAGRELVPRFAPVIQHARNALLAGVPVEDSDRLGALLQRLLDNLRAAEPAAIPHETAATS
jgi:DNA-binding MarR family transcriptional regulator